MLNITHYQRNANQNHGSFPMSQLFAWGGQSIGVSASASVLPMNIQDWSPLGWTGWISLQSKGLSRVFSNTTVQKHLVLWHSAFFTIQLSHLYMTTGKTIALTRWTSVGKVMSLLLSMLSRLVITSECWALSQLFHSPLSLSSTGFLVPFHFLPWGWCHLHIWGYWYFSQQSWFQLV